MSVCTRPARPLSALTPASMALTVRTLRTRARDTTTTAPPASPGDVAQRRMRTIETMPFQTYQLALEVIRKDRAEKLRLIKAEHEKMAKLVKYKGLNPQSREGRSIVQYLDNLKIKADINNPRVKYNFDTGIIGMNKPVYRYLLERKWRAMRRPVLMQRLTQMNVVPDVLPGVNPIVDVQVRFGGRDIQPGVFVKSKTSERRPTFKIIPFQQGEKLCTVAVVDPDVPDTANDSFRYRLHWIVSNVCVSPTQTQAFGTGANPCDEIVPYLPPCVQKGAPYHRYAMFVFQQPDNARIDAGALVGTIDRETFNLRAFQTKQRLETIGAFMWRGQWDDGTKEVMQRNGIEGWDIMYTRVKDIDT